MCVVGREEAAGGMGGQGRVVGWFLALGISGDVSYPHQFTDHPSYILHAVLVFSLGSRNARLQPTLPLPTPLPYLTLPCTTSAKPTLPCPTLPYPTLRYPAVPHPTL